MVYSQVDYLISVFEIIPLLKDDQHPTYVIMLCKRGTSMISANFFRNTCEKNERKSEQAHIPHAPTKKLNQNFLWICIPTYYVLYYYKVKRNSVERFQRNCADKLCWVVSLILAKFLSSKRMYLREKN